MKQGTPLPEDALKAFLEQKAFMLKKPILALPRDAPYHLYVDGSLGEVDDENSGGVGAVLVEEDTLGRKRALGCFSRSLRKHEKNYNAFLVEQLAITAALEHFHIYLLGREFTLYSDHEPLVKLSKNQTRTFSLLQQKQAEYQFNLVHVKGSVNPSDWMSRNTPEKTPDEKMESVTMKINPSLGIPEQTMKAAQDLDPMITCLKEYLEDNTNIKTLAPMWLRLFRMISKDCKYFNAHNGGNDRFSARLGILTILTIGFFVYGNQNYDSIWPQKGFFVSTIMPHRCWIERQSCLKFAGSILNSCKNR
jgi:hypothetical protein